MEEIDIIRGFVLTYPEHPIAVAWATMLETTQESVKKWATIIYSPLEPSEFYIVATNILEKGVTLEQANQYYYSFMEDE